MENLFKKRQERLHVFKKTRNQIIHHQNKKEIPDNVFTTCENCKRSISYLDMRENKYVCPTCKHPNKISARERIRQWVDDSTFKEVDALMTTTNTDKFIGYDEKLERYKQSTGLNEAVVYGVGKINNQRCVLAVMDSNFMMGSMGAVVGEKITRAVELAHKKNYPLIISCTSGGARMQEGIVSLMQMAKTSAALKNFSDDGGLYISVLTHPTTGGVSASFAMLGDIIIAEPHALIAFAGKRVIEKTINEVLPDEFQRAEFVLEKGFVDMIVNRFEMKQVLGDLLAYHGGKH